MNRETASLILFPFLMAFFMSGTMSCFLTVIHSGISFSGWIKNWSSSFLVAVPAAFIFSHICRKISRFLISKIYN